jgi:hypothetical protein
MRTAILTFAFVMGMAAVVFAIPLTPSAGPSVLFWSMDAITTTLKIISGWHRHDKNCNTLRGTVKNRNSVKS